MRRKHQIRDWADRLYWRPNVEIDFSYENGKYDRLFKFIIKVISIPKIEPKIEPNNIEEKEEQTWTITYSTQNDNTDKVWVYGRNKDEAIENAKDEYWDIEEIISVTKMADGGEIAAAEHNIKQAKYGAKMSESDKLKDYTKMKDSELLALNKKLLTEVKPIPLSLIKELNKRGLKKSYIGTFNSNMSKGGKIVGKQKNLDVNKNGKLDAEDFKMLRGEKMADGGILKVSKGENDKYYWKFTFENGKEEKSFDGFNTMADAQKDFAYRSRYLKMAKGGKVKFEDKVKAVKESLLKRKKVSPKVQKDYGKTYDRKEALEAAKRIVGAQTAKYELKKKFKEGGKTIAQTTAPKKDRVFGSSKNKAGSASSKKTASNIELNESIVKTLGEKAKKYNENHSSKVSTSTLKAVMRRGMGAYSTSHRPTITGGAPNSRQAWGFARVNKFLLKKGGTKVKAAYVQDDDLL